MAQKTICDICKREITIENYPLYFGYKGIRLHVSAVQDTEQEFDAILCRHCIIDAFVAQDDRPKEMPSEKAHPLDHMKCYVYLKNELDPGPHAVFLSKAMAESFLSLVNHRGTITER